MPTKTKLRTTIELNPGDKERLQNIALGLGCVQTTTENKGQGSISQLMQAIARNDILCFTVIPKSDSDSTATYLYQKTSSTS